MMNTWREHLLNNGHVCYSLIAAVRYGYYDCAILLLDCY